MGIVVYVKKTTYVQQQPHHWTYNVIQGRHER